MRGEKKQDEKKLVEGGFSDFFCQVCICQQVANKAARFRGCFFVCLFCK